jgi:hypothetical protein
VENDRCEGFDFRLRGAPLKGEIFSSPTGPKIVIESWRHHQPERIRAVICHSATGHPPRRPFGGLLVGGSHSSELARRASFRTHKGFADTMDLYSGPFSDPDMVFRLFR